VVLRVNGRQRLLQLDSRVALLDGLLEHLDLVGPKKGCDQGCSRVEILSKEVMESSCVTRF